MIHLSPSAASEIRRLRSQRNSDKICRLQVQAGGCSGLFYDLAFDEAVRQGDQVYNYDGLEIVVDAQSLNHIKGLILDYTEDLMGGGFRFHNPNATASCGCGNSFSTVSEKQVSR